MFNIIVKWNPPQWSEASIIYIWCWCLKWQRLTPVEVGFFCSILTLFWLYLHVSISLNFLYGQTNMHELPCWKIDTYTGTTLYGSLIILCFHDPMAMLYTSCPRPKKDTPLFCVKWDPPINNQKIISYSGNTLNVYSLLSQK